MVQRRIAALLIMLPVTMAFGLTLFWCRPDADVVVYRGKTAAQWEKLIGEYNPLPYYPLGPLRRIRPQWWEVWRFNDARRSEDRPEFSVEIEALAVGLDPAADPLLVKLLE